MKPIQMLIKAKSHRHANPQVLFDKLINYLIDDKGHSKEETAWSFFHNLSSHDSKGIVAEFVENAKLKKQRKNSVQAYHYILSFHELDSDKVSPEIMQDLIEKFLELRKEKGIAFSRIHESQKHIHAHVVISSNLFGSNKANRMSRKEFLEVHRKLEEYQREKYPELSHSLVKVQTREKNRRINSEKEKPLTEGEKKMRERMEKQSITPSKEVLKRKLIAWLENAPSVSAYFDKLQANGFSLYEYRTTVRGIISQDGKRFRFSTLGISKGMIRELMSEREKRMMVLRNGKMKNPIHEIRR